MIGPQHLSPSGLLRLVIDRGLVAAEDVVRGDVLIEDVSRRNRNYRIVVQGKPSYQIKQAVTAEGAESVEHEHRVYQALANLPGRAASAIPREHGFDANTGLLILELLPGARTLGDHAGRFRRSAAWIGAAIGRALGALHSLSVSDVLHHDHEHPPWPLKLHEPSLNLFHQMTWGNQQLIRVLQHDAVLGQGLDRLAESWRPMALTHGDIKWDNWVLSRDAGERRARLVLVDWELAGESDPAWDLGSALQDYLVAWLRSIPIRSDTPPARAADLANRPLSSMHPAMRSLWGSYVRERALPAIEANDLLDRSTRYAAARLVQTAYEYGQRSHQIGALPVLMLQVSANIFRRPREAAVHLFGLAPADT